MAVFLRCEGIEGDCAELNHVKWIEIMAYSFSIQKSVAEDIVVTKLLDSSSSELARACFEGRLIDEIVLELTMSMSEFGSSTYMRYVFADCYIKYLQTSAHSSELPMEQVSFSFQRVEWTYSQHDETGKRVGDIASSFVVPNRQELIDPTNQAPRIQQYKPNTAFIMMWMNPDRPELDDVCNTIKDVFRDYRIKAVRADDIQHEDKITDITLGHIAQSEFLIADLSGERPNVYYEVGFAHALGKRPLLYRRSGTPLHFDLAVHNVREYRNITELRDMLKRRLDVLVNN